MLLFLRVSAPRREKPVVIASWKSCVTVAREFAIGGGGVGRVRGRSWVEFPAKTLRRREVCFVSLFLRVYAPRRDLAFVMDRRKPCAHVEVQFDGVSGKRNGYCLRVRKGMTAQMQFATPVSLL